MKILSIVGARPNFMKIAPFIRALHAQNIESILVNTGQHYDYEMSKVFFEELGIPKPNYDLNVGSGTHAKQTAQVMIELEPILIKEKPDCVVVVGDVNSTLAGALTAAKLCIPVAHIEAGLRSYDRTMPEEINRILTDHISDYLFVPSPDGVENLKKEGVAPKKIHFIGNIMIDTLLAMAQKIDSSPMHATLGLKEKRYCILTLHRPVNVDTPQALLPILETLEEIQSRIPIVWAIHPRTKKNIDLFGLKEKVHSMKELKLIDPVGYIEFMNLVKNSKFVLTDSGGVQEETTVLGIPCITMRETTERPITVTEGTNVVTGTDRGKILGAVKAIENNAEKKGKIPELWDGKAAERIVSVLLKKA